MNTVAHTPGPWTLGSVEDEARQINCADVGVVCAVWPMAEDFNTIDSDIDDAPERDANARLIAAAPEMHAFLTMIDSWGYSVTQDSAADVVDKARALLARIRGAEVHQ